METITENHIKWPSSSNSMYFNMKGSIEAHPVTGLQFFININLSLRAPLRAYVGQSCSYTEGYLNRVLHDINDLSKSGPHHWWYSALQISEGCKEMEPSPCLSLQTFLQLLSAFLKNVFLLQYFLSYWNTLNRLMKDIFIWVSVMVSSC